jgi:hypothetical protein
MVSLDRMRLGLLIIGVVGVCVVMSACGATAGKGKGRHSLIGYTTSPQAQPDALIVKRLSKHCLPLTMAGLDREIVPGTPCVIVLSI